MEDTFVFTLALPANTAAAVNTKAPVPMKILLAFIIKGLKICEPTLKKVFGIPFSFFISRMIEKSDPSFVATSRWNMPAIFIFIYFYSGMYFLPMKMNGLGANGTVAGPPNISSVYAPCCLHC
jgi:hypothetical protein